MPRYDDLLAAARIGLLVLPIEGSTSVELTGRVLRVGTLVPDTERAHLVAQLVRSVPPRSPAVSP